MNTLEDISEFILFIQLIHVISSNNFVFKSLTIFNVYPAYTAPSTTVRSVFAMSGMFMYSTNRAIKCNTDTRAPTEMHATGGIGIQVYNETINTKTIAKFFG